MFCGYEQRFTATVRGTYNNHFVYTDLNKLKNINNISDAL
jgi:hypothetical protein